MRTWRISCHHLQTWAGAYHGGRPPPACLGFVFNWSVFRRSFLISLPKTLQGIVDVRLLQARCLSCHPANSVKALKALTMIHSLYIMLAHTQNDRFIFFSADDVGTGIRGLMRGMATLPQGDQELLVVRDKVGRPPGELGVSRSMECDIFPSVL